MLAYARGSVRRRWFENEDGSIRLTLEGPHARLRSVQVRFLRRQPSDAPAFAPLWVQWCSTGFIFCVTPHRFGFSQFLSLN